MPEIQTPDFLTYRRRTRTYDADGDNTKAVIDAISALLAPAGTLIPSVSEVEPDSGAWKLCNGQTLSKAEYPRLYSIMSGRVTETETTFDLPDLRGRIMMGQGAAVDFGALAGAASVTLTVDQMPEHGHSINDPGHTHAFTGAEHSHTITDPGHTHTAAGVSETNEQPFISEDPSPTPIASAVSAQTGSATTGIDIDLATAGGANATATTGISVQNAGGGSPVSIIPPVFGVNWMVRT